MRTPSPVLGKIALAAATPVAMLIAATLVWQSSYAAFSGTTRNSGNDWATGSISLTDDDSGSSRFQVGSLTPGQTETKCIKVTANASVPGVVKGYAINPVVSAAHLEDHIIITVRGGAGGDFSSCTGFVSDAILIPGLPLSTVATFNTYANGMGGWSVSPGTQSRTYEITWTFDTTGMTQTQVDNLQGSHAGIDLQWELQSS